MLNKILAVALLALVACASPPTQQPAALNTPLSNQTDDLQVAIVPSELIVGPNRFAVGLIDPKKGMVKEVQVHFRYFDLSDPNKPALESEADAVRLQTPDGATTIYAHEREFKRAGNWGVELQARLSDGISVIKRVSFQVLAKSATKKPGDKAPVIDTPTAADVANDFKKITSAEKPNEAFYKLSLRQALANGKPTVLLFSTPAFCQTRMCGPAYDITSALQSKYGDAFNWVHVEVFAGLPNPAATNFQRAPAMREFGLNTEPWLYLIDKSGTIVYRVEGVFTEAEVENHLKSLL